jgi:hypothetical protein
MHIENLYRETAQNILLFREVYATEKIHGTSCHISWKEGKIGFFSGGVSHENFVAIFDVVILHEKLLALGHDNIIIYGEGYGGKCQGMSKTYGPNLRFVVFDVKIGDSWLNVPNAHDVAKKLGLEFVHYNRIPADIVCLDSERDAPSEQAKRNGISESAMREGIVIHPLMEFFDNKGNRVIAKHKRPEFSERKTIPAVDPTKRELMEKADDIAREFVTDMRLTHVLDKLGNPSDVTATGEVIKAMIEDVCREASGEIVDNKTIRRAIGSVAAKIFKRRIMQVINYPQE